VSLRSQLRPARSLGVVAALLVAAALPAVADQHEGASEESEEPPRSGPARVLDDGWLELLNGLGTARWHVENPWREGPAPGERELAEGYRYLLGHLARIIEAEVQQHPDFPYFQRSVRMLSKWTIDNPDTMYLRARIDPDGTYRIRAEAANPAQWRTSERRAEGPKAPRLVTFQTITHVIGDTGELSELSDCRNQTLGYVQHFQLQPDAEGRFEVWVGPERPKGAIHYLPTRREMACPGPDGEVMQLREARHVSVRETFSDWDNEVPLELEIVRIGREGAPRPPPDAATVAEELRVIGRKVGHQIHFWNQLHEFGLEIFDDRNGDGRRAQPVNALNDPAPPFIAGGTAGSRQLYAAGKWDLAKDEALVVKATAPVEPHYVGFQLANFWGESADQANYTSSRNGAQLPLSSDGSRYYVVAHRDPGVPGWLDTTGLPQGQMSMRFVFRSDVPDGRLPKVRTTKTTLARLRRSLPKDTPEVTAEQRREEVARRQAHIQRRWRQY